MVMFNTIYTLDNILTNDNLERVLLHFNKKKKVTRILLPTIKLKK